MPGDPKDSLFGLALMAAAKLSLAPVKSLAFHAMTPWL